MPNTNTDLQRKAGFYHSLGKVITEQYALVGEEAYKSAHNVRSNEVWMDIIPHSNTYASASSISDNVIVTQCGTSSNPVYLYPLTQTNYQTWFIDMGTPSAAADGFIPSSDWAKPLINPSDVPDSNGYPSWGYQLSMYRPDGTTPIAYGSAFYDVDYFSGLIRFQENATPKDSSVDSGLGFQFNKSAFESTANNLKKAYIQSTSTGGPRVIAWQYIGQLLSNFNFNQGQGLTAGQGLTSSESGGSVTLSINIGTQSGLTFSNNNELTVSIDNSTIQLDSNGQLYVAGGGSSPIYQTSYSLVTTGNDQPTGLTLSNIPTSFSSILVFINGQLQRLGDGVTTDDCYFTDGFTIKNFNNLSLGDELYWNGLISRFNLDTQDLIQIIYEA